MPETLVTWNDGMGNTVNMSMDRARTRMRERWLHLAAHLRRPSRLLCVLCVAACFFSSGCASAMADSGTPHTTAPSKAHQRPTRKIKKSEISGMATWYGKRFQGRTTASGERFDMHKMTAAHKTFPFGTIVRVTRTDTRQSVVVRINDRGPYSKGRIIDLAKAAAAEIDLVRKGVAPVKLEILRWGNP